MHGTLTLKGVKMDFSDLSALSLKDMQELEERLRVEKMRKERSERSAAKQKLTQIAAEMGFNIVDLFGFGGEFPPAEKTRQRKSPEPKYFQKDGDGTWSGRGKKPRWVEDYLAGGGSLEDLVKQ